MLFTHTTHRKTPSQYRLVPALLLFLALSACGGSSSSPSASSSTSTSSVDTESVLYSFAGNDGANPLAGVIMDSQGNVYGTTRDGGSAGYGAVFELSPAASGGYTEAVLYSFTGGTDGTTPSGGLTMDSAGDLYGTTVSGGSGYGTVFELSPATGGGYTEKVLYSFIGGSDGFTPIGGLVMDSSGDLYGTTMSGSPDDDGALFELSPVTYGGYIESVYAFTGSNGSTPSGGLILDSKGDVYGTTEDGGSDSEGVVFELTP
jgi:uncharacterized repeat protein (TIGR03803 family)